MGATLAVGLIAGGGYMFCCMPLTVIGGAREGAMLIFAPCIPFLLALPGIVYVAGEQFFRGTEGGTMLFAYIAGMVGYSVAALVLVGHSIGSFDARTGRTRLSSSAPRPLVMATAVEESPVPAT
jgi:hypothetical protein